MCQSLILLFFQTTVVTAMTPKSLSSALTSFWSLALVSSCLADFLDWLSQVYLKFTVSNQNCSYSSCFLSFSSENISFCLSKLGNFWVILTFFSLLTSSVSQRPFERLSPIQLLLCPLFSVLVATSLVQTLIIFLPGRILLSSPFFPTW